VERHVVANVSDFRRRRGREDSAGTSRSECGSRPAVGDVQNDETCTSLPMC